MAGRLTHQKWLPVQDAIFAAIRDGEYKKAVSILDKFIDQESGRNSNAQD